MNAMIKKFCTALFAIMLLSFGFSSCKEKPEENSLKTYFKQKSGMQNGGVTVIPIHTGKRVFHVWTKRIGDNPKMKLLLLNGGPGLTHEYMECFESFMPAEGIELIYYDQLGCGNSDNPNDTTLWQLPRFVEEVEEVRQALGLNKDNFYLLGHSWGGILALDYALKYQKNLKGLIISNMMCSGPEYGRYADEVLSKQMDPKVLDTIRMIEKIGDFSNPKYMELLMPNYYAKHIIKMPVDQWPEPMNRSFKKLNSSLYVTMQGPSEFGIAGNLATWDRKAELKNIKVATLTIGAKDDTMDPAHMEWMSKQFPKGHYLYCPNGSHMSMYDDQTTYMQGVIRFIKETDSGKN